MDINNQRVGIVVPTLGRREDFLETTLRSIKSSSNVYVLIVCPDFVDLSKVKNLFDERVSDPGNGLADAINTGIANLPQDIELTNWLGDDDFLEPNAINLVRNLIYTNTDAVAAFGKCAYVNEDGQELFINHSGRWAVPLLNFGPNLIPQPGMLFKRSSFNEVGGLNGEFGWAFDFDLLLKLKTVGKILYLNQKVANFRWHPGSLSVGLRENSVTEASRVRKNHLPKLVKPLSFLWEQPVIYLTLKAGERLSRRVQKA